MMCEGRCGADDLLFGVEWNIAENHVVQQTTEGPDGGGLSVVAAVLQPLRTDVHQRACMTTTMRYIQNP